MKAKSVNQMNLDELRDFRRNYEGRTDHVAKLMLVRIDEAIEIAGISMKHTGSAHVKWAQLAAPNGEVFEGFWVFRADENEPIIFKPFARRADADAMALLENAASYLVANYADEFDLSEPLDIIDGAYRQVINWQKPN